MQAEGIRFRSARFWLFFILALCWISPILAQGGALEGSVTHSVTGEPIASFRAWVYSFDEHGFARTSSGRDGGFVVDGISPGTYTVAIVDPTLVDQMYGGIRCESSGGDPCVNVELGTPFEVVEGATVSGIDFEVDRLGVITGSVTGLDATMWVRAYASTDLQPAVSEQIHRQGDYVLEGLAPGSYLVAVSGEEIIDEIYDDVPCVQELTLEGCDNLAAGDRVAVDLNLVVEQVDFEVRAGGSLSGTVTDLRTGAPIPSVTVNVWDAAARRRRDGRSDSEGRYRVSGLNPGTYTATTSQEQGVHNHQLFDGLECPGSGFDPGLCDVTAGTPIAIAAATDTPGIDFALRPRASIAGRVTDAATGEPLGDVTVRIYDPEGRQVSSGRARGGSYEAGGLDAGTYYALAGVHSGSRHISEIYDDVPCPGYFPGPCEPHLEGAPIEVAADAVVEGVDFALDLGGTISGRIIDAATGEPLGHDVAGLTITVWTAEGLEVTFGGNDQEARFSLPDSHGPGLATGNYFVTVFNRDDYLGEVWGGPYCPYSSRCDPTRGVPVPVAVRRDTPNIDFELDVGGTITGTVVEAATGERLHSIGVRATDAEGEYFGGVTLGGDYSIGPLPAGGYAVRTTASRHLNQVYDGHNCPDNRCEAVSGDPVAVSLGAATGDVDFALLRLGGFSGRVTAQATGEPLAGFTVSAWSAERGTGNVTSGPDGSYTFSRLLPGTYYAIVEERSGFDWIPELYDGRLCPWGFYSCDIAAGQPITVEIEHITEGVDFALERAGTVSGRVLDTATGEPVASGFVSLFTAAGDAVSHARTDRDGRYLAKGFRRALYPGTYYAFAGFRDYLHEVYDGVKCPRFDFLSCDLSRATPLVVANGSDRAGVDFALDLGASIAGRVTSAITGEPVDDAALFARDASGAAVDWAFSDSGGSYRIPGLPEATYYVTAETEAFADQLYPDLPCPQGGCDVTGGTPIAAAVASPVEGIDFALTPPGPCEGDLEMCLQRDRFRVRVKYRHYFFGEGDAHAVKLTDQSGVFWFLIKDHVDLIVKVLDGCATPFNSYWVYAAGLTVDEVEIEVTDLAAGVTWRSSSPSGRFEPILDTRAFETCGAGSSKAAERSPTAAELRLYLPELFALDRLVSKGDCVPNGTSLCQGDGRFRVETRWRTPDGKIGSAQAFPLTDETGLFWFFDPGNLELMVRAGDGCDQPFDRFFRVRAAGLTDVEVTLRVTDLETGDVWEYLSPLGTVFPPVTALEAFATCP